MSAKTMVRMFAGACASVAGLLAVQVPSHALPGDPFPLAPSDCDWIIFDTDSTIKQDNGINVHVAWAHTDGGGTADFPANGGTWQGPVSGGIVKGTNQLDFTADFKGGFPIGGGPQEQVSNHYTGTINSAGNGASGVTINSTGVKNNWTIDGGFKCIGRAPAEPAKNPENTPPASQAPPPAEKPPTDMVRMLITPALPNVKVHVSSTATIPGHCTYHAEEVNGLIPPVDEAFDIAKMGSKDLTFLAPGIGQRWQVVLSCRGDFNGQDVEFGHQEQSVAGFGG